MKTQLRAVVRLLLEQRALYAIGGVFLALGLVAALSYPILVKRLIDEGVLVGRMSRVNELALMLLALLAAEGVATVVRDYYFNLAAERVTARLRQRVFDHLLRQEIGFFDGQNVGALTGRLWDDVSVINRVVGEPLGAAVRYALVGVLGTAMLVYTSPALTLLLKLATAVEVARRRILANSTRGGVSFAVGEAAALFGLWAGANLILQGRLTSGAVIS